jgi:hypothetical protein
MPAAAQARRMQTESWRNAIPFPEYAAESQARNVPRIHLLAYQGVGWDIGKKHFLKPFLKQFPVHLAVIISCFCSAFKDKLDVGNPTRSSPLTQTDP